MKKLLQKYIEIYPDGNLSKIFIVLIENTECKEIPTIRIVFILEESEIITYDEVANFKNLLVSYESI